VIGDRSKTHPHEDEPELSLTFELALAAWIQASGRGGRSVGIVNI